MTVISESIPIKMGAIPTSPPGSPVVGKYKAKIQLFRNPNPINTPITLISFSMANCCQSSVPMKRLRTTFCYKAWRAHRNIKLIIQRAAMTYSLRWRPFNYPADIF